MFFLNVADNKGHQLSANVLENNSHTGAEAASGSLDQSAAIEKEYRDKVQNQDDPLVVVGLDGSVKFTSWNFEEQTGLHPETIAEKPFFNNLNPEDMPTYFAAFGKVIETGKPMTMVGPYHLRESDGTYKLHMGAIYPIADESGKVVKLCLTSRNISDQVKKSPEAGS
jgi:PAS domain S-box-containing protein